MKSRGLEINRLVSGGVITNYNCTSRCRHCLYQCSPGRSSDYVSEDTLRRNFSAILQMGCGSVHIGGGEPFLDPKGLGLVLATARSEGMGIDYVETNSSWYRDRRHAAGILSELKEAGLHTLLVSISPFHNEYIPFKRVKGVLDACEKAGVRVFPWVMDFFSEIDSLDDAKTHSLEEYEAAYGPGYLARLPSRYWIHPGGRALETFAPVMGTLSVEEVLSLEKRGCDELMDTSHFHTDLYGRYVPGLCSGLAFEVEFLGKEVPADRYPLLDVLYKEGVRGLYSLASERHGYRPERAFLNKCHLCFDMRRYLANNARGRYPELHPEGFYG